jgi:hypothetical protein
MSLSCYIISIIDAIDNNKKGDEKMAIRREDIHKLIETVPDENLDELVKVIKLFTISEEEPTEDEVHAINEARNEDETGETLQYTIDKLHKELKMSRDTLELVFLIQAIDSHGGI